jgi:hypothetical protein
MCLHQKISIYLQATIQNKLTVEECLSWQSICCSSRNGDSSASCERSGGVAVNLFSAQTFCCNPLEDMEMDILDLHHGSPCGP